MIHHAMIYQRTIHHIVKDARQAPLPYLLLGLVLSLFVANSFAAVDVAPSFGPQIVLKDFGLYDLLQREKRDFTAQATAGYSSVIRTRHRKSTSHVPLELGQAFGFSFTVNDPAAQSEWVAVKIDIQHPPTTNYLGQRSEGFTMISAARLHQDGYFHNGAYYVFSEPYEMAAGEWIIRVSYGERVLQKTFLVAPASMFNKEATATVFSAAEK